MWKIFKQLIHYIYSEIIHNNDCADNFMPISKGTNDVLCRETEIDLGNMR